MSLPILYSFRRCPYAIRARLAIAYSALSVELREVELRNKPACMLVYSPKATVPVLVLSEGRVIDESLDVMHWALSRHDPAGWLLELSSQNRARADQLIENNDNIFKPCLDRYKYADRHPQQSPEDYRLGCEPFLTELENLLAGQDYLLGDTVSIADAAIFPFVRQFAFVDKPWFDSSDYSQLQVWLQRWIDSDLFSQQMIKRPSWVQGDRRSLVL